MKTRSKSFLIAAAVIIAIAIAVTALNSFATNQAAEKVRTPTKYSASPTPIKNYAKLPGTWTYDCEFPVQRPHEIMLTCGDGGMVITDITWKSWTTSGATGTGMYSQNMCHPNCTNGTRVDASVSIKLSKPFEYKGRNVLKTLDIHAARGRELPNGGTRMTWDVAEFAAHMNWDVKEKHVCHFLRRRVQL